MSSIVSSIYNYFFENKIAVTLNESVSEPVDYLTVKRNFKKYDTDTNKWIDAEYIPTFNRYNIDEENPDIFRLDGNEEFDNKELLDLEKSGKYFCNYPEDTDANNVKTVNMIDRLGLDKKHTCSVLPESYSEYSGIISRNGDIVRSIKFLGYIDSITISIGGQVIYKESKDITTKTKTTVYLGIIVPLYTDIYVTITGTEEISADVEYLFLVESDRKKLWKSTFIANRIEFSNGYFNGVIRELAI